VEVLPACSIIFTRAQTFEAFDHCRLDDTELLAKRAQDDLAEAQVEREEVEPSAAQARSNAGQRHRDVQRPSRHDA